MEIAEMADQPDSRPRKRRRKGTNTPNARKRGVEVNDVSGGVAARIFYYLISAGKAL